MKVYANKFDLASPSTRQLTTPSYSDFGVGIKILKNGVEFGAEFTFEKDGETMTPEADKIDGYTVYVLSSEGAGSTVYKVRCGGQSFDLICVAADEQFFFKKEEGGGGSSEKYGVEIDGVLGDVDPNGVLQLPSQSNFDGSGIVSIPDSLYVRQQNSYIYYGPMLGKFTGGQVQTVSFPDLTSVGNNGLYGAFGGCTSLSSISFPELESIGGLGMGAAFSGDTALKQVEFPKIVELVSHEFNSTFLGCTGLTSVSFPNMTTVGGNSLRQCFSGCTSLTHVHMPKVSTCNTYGFFQAFVGCTSLEVVDFSEATAVPTLDNANIFLNTNSTFKIVVPDALYDTWIAANNWSTYANQFVKKSEFSE